MEKILQLKVWSISKILLFFILGAAVLGPAFFNVNIGPISLSLFRITLYALWVIFVLLLLKNDGEISITNLKVRLLVWFLIFWFVYSIISLLWADSTIDAVKHINHLFVGFSLIIFVVFFFIEKRDYIHFYRLWIFILTVLILVGLWNVLTGQQLSVSTLAGLTNEQRFTPTAIFHNQNDFATYLALSLPFTLTLIRYGRNLLVSLFGIILSLLNLSLVFLTYSRSNYLAIAMGVAFWFFFFMKRREKLFLIVLTLSGTMVLYFLFPEPFHSALDTLKVQIDSLFVHDQGKESVNVRTNLIKNSLLFLYDHYGFGVGAGNAEYHMAHFRVYDTAKIVNVHNWWFELLVNYGILIFSGYVLFYLSLIILLKKQYHTLTDRNEKMIAESLIIGLVIFFLASTSSSTIIAFGPQWLFFAFTVGYLNYLYLKQERNALAE
ncbi:O-antigen ligase family protein [Tepidibacillus fermentans]|uniref:Teichuronic acid biosynthesis protein TuaE n=1 Tax=Tepidibacillus fermentans TaxID=1281767 RepID=A0A4R3KJB9_9BACI|nr:O-antigen ligase family protein [Tepidibacillus fermentans]TCS83365.1 teichuronic acid biosynthesis protein TuaE [Tepidibacillus fermentans]